MKILVIGANGQIGKQLVEKIQNSEHEAVAMIRKEEQKSYFEDLGAGTALVNLEDDVETIASAYDGVDAVIFTAGSGPKTGVDKTVLIDLDAAVKTIQAAEKAGVKRYVLVSSFETDRSAIQESPESFRPYVVAKHYADKELRASKLNYTIVHPGILTNDQAKGQVELAETVERGEVPRADVAEVLFRSVTDNETIGKEFQVVSGSTDIQEALKSL